MTKVYPHIIPDIEQWPIYKLHEDRAGFIEEMNDFTLEKLKTHPVKSVDELLASTIYLEKIRLKNEPWKVDPGNEPIYWKKLEKEFNANKQDSEGDEKNEQLIRRIINRYSQEIVGNFAPGTFRFARKFLTSFFRRLLNSAAGRNHRRLWGSRYQMIDRLLVSGHVEDMRSLIQKGTVIIVPTHSSNLDSILIGYTMDYIAGVPAFSYGAGLNLYDAELIAYFMNRLGAYKVDRRKRNPIYLECLKSFSSLSILRGVHSIFFPGGTRSRSGTLEKNVKLGLLSTLIEAQRMHCIKNEDKKIFIIPLVLGYHSVLEAKYLIEQHLRHTGREKYIKTSGKDTSLRSMIGFLWNLFSQGSEISLTFGKAMDVFGNNVNEEGQSFDEFGNQIEVEDYFKMDHKIGQDRQREKVYTKLLGKKITESYYRENLILSSQLVAYTSFRYLMHVNKNQSLYDIFSLPTEDFIIPKEVFEDMVFKLQEALLEKKKHGELKLSDKFNSDVIELIEDGLKNLGIYHPQKPLFKDKEGNYISADFKLLYFYHNRLEGYGLEKVLNLSEPIDYELAT